MESEYFNSFAYCNPFYFVTILVEPNCASNEFEINLEYYTSSSLNLQFFLLIIVQEELNEDCKSSDEPSASGTDYNIVVN